MQLTFFYLAASDDVCQVVPPVEGQYSLSVLFYSSLYIHSLHVHVLSEATCMYKLCMHTTLSEVYETNCDV